MLKSYAPALLAMTTGVGLTLLSAGAAVAATTPSKENECISVRDTTITNFLNQKVPAWRFTSECNYALTFYVLYPGATAWAPSVKFNPLQSIAYLSNGKPAKLTQILQCPKGWTAIGTNPKLCYK